MARACQARVHWHTQWAELRTRQTLGSAVIDAALRAAYPASTIPPVADSMRLIIPRRINAANQRLSSTLMRTVYGLRAPGSIA